MATVITDQTSGVDTDKSFKVPVDAATTANITLSGLQTVDGIVLTADQRVLVKDQNDSTENGIYKTSTGNWTRTEDFDGPRDTATGTTVFVTAGTVHAAKYFYISTMNNPAPGAAITFTQAPINSVTTANAIDISYDNTGTGIQATNVDYAIDEVNFNAQRFIWNGNDTYASPDNKFASGYGITLRLVDTDAGSNTNNVMYFDVHAVQEANVTINGTTVTSVTLDMDDGGHLRFIEFTGNGTISITKHSTYPASYKLIIKDGGAHTITWDSNILWPGDGTPPSLPASGTAIVNIDYDKLNDKLYGTLQGSGYQ